MALNKEVTKFKLPSLNGLRAISILLVIFRHLEIEYHLLLDKLPNALKPFYIFFSDGQLGVNMFFVISGFLITTLLIVEEEKTKTVSLKNFYIRRTLRIFPAYYFYLLVLLILQLTNVIYINNESWLTAVTYTKYFNWSSDWFTSHGWSLSIEEHFYLMFPLIFTFGDKIRKRASLFLILIVPVIKVLVHFYPVSWINDYTIFKRIDALVIGCVIAFYKDSLLNLLDKHFKTWFYLSLVILFVIGFLPGIGERLNLNLDFIIIPFGSRYGTFANICIGVVLLYSIYGHKGIWFKLLNTKVLDYIGLLSYSIYLWQQLFISGSSLSWASSFPLNILFFISAALFSYYCIEKPFLKFKDKFQKT
ncbi:acyltransferase 3 (plasmid) [Emticicia oligotrophica DSM 17448]|uniref:Acyltransferase 3 n=1 Tax=Emticicia oligotrophica (strain DSM 17448 / CIP 109782 / MTCC 6937 / GPTSA100-15) TaxID=929562 RepID=A0ABM5N847_EMTOG|nr:acyltransferase [Emticicia oligotrophica]AFK05720.1 acyltransferase 3 [Emticicia oligotrophica DSM 17448]